MSDNFMVSIEKAINLIDQTIEVSKSVVKIPLEKCLNRYLAEDLYAPINMPPFSQSAMDGYAVLYNDEHQNNFKLVGEIQAGDNKNIELKPGEAIRIFTGAPTPLNANAVIMQEKTSVKDNTLIIEDSLSHYKNIRPLGEQIQKDKLALEKGTLLNEAAIGYLATLGFSEIPSYKKPSISIVVTGNELVNPGTPLEFGQIYESNAIMLQMALYQRGFYKADIIKVKDNYQDTLNQLDHCIQKSDFVLISGGISVGDYDYVEQALKELGTEQVFYKIKQKPGKPLFFGKNKNTAVFALPGNPASALTCFYMYIQSCLEKHVGNPNYKLTPIQLPISHSYTKKGTRGEFLKAEIKNNSVSTLTGQSSAMLNTFALSNALVFIPEDTFEVKENEMVTVFKIN